MANDISQSPYIIDTASASVIFAGLVMACTFRWIGATTAGHQCVVKDGTGRVVYAAIANAANFVDEGWCEVNFRGLIVDTLGSGTLYIYTE